MIVDGIFKSNDIYVYTLLLTTNVTEDFTYAQRTAVKQNTKLIFVLLTGVHVGAECEGAVLDVEGKAEDLQVAGTDEPQHPVPADVTRVVDVHVGTLLGHVVIHTRGGREG